MGHQWLRKFMNFQEIENSTMWTEESPEHAMENSGASGSQEP